jgi:hypothetical protein
MTAIQQNQANSYFYTPAINLTENTASETDQGRSTSTQPL